LPTIQISDLVVPEATQDLPPRSVNPEPFVAEMIAVARWVAGLAEAWSSVETTHTSKERLAEGDMTPRQPPVDLTVSLAA
jgi:hypothetical protein